MAYMMPLIFKISHRSEISAVGNYFGTYLNTPRVTIGTSHMDVLSNTACTTFFAITAKLSDVIRRLIRLG